MFITVSPLYNPLRCLSPARLCFVFTAKTCRATGITVYHCLGHCCFTCGASHRKQLPNMLWCKSNRQGTCLWYTPKQAKKKGRWTRGGGQCVWNAILPVLSTFGRAGRRQIKTNTIPSYPICSSAGLYCWWVGESVDAWAFRRRLWDYKNMLTLELRQISAWHALFVSWVVYGQSGGKAQTVCDICLVYQPTFQRMDKHWITYCIERVAVKAEWGVSKNEVCVWTTRETQGKWVFEKAFMRPCWSNITSRHGF